MALRGGSLHGRAERAFEAWGHLVYRRRWLMLALSGLVSALLISHLPQLVFDNSQENALRKGDPARRIYNEFRRQYEQDHVILVVVRAPGDLFELRFLERLRALHRDLEAEVPHLDEVTSLVNARLTRGKGDELIVDDLLEDWPETRADLELVRQRVRSTPAYRNTLVNEAETLTTLLVKPIPFSESTDVGAALAGFEEPVDVPADPASLEMLSEDEMRALVEGVRNVIQRHAAPGVDIHMGGKPVWEVHLNDMMLEDLSVLLPAGVAINAVILWALFRRVSGVALPLVFVLVSLFSAWGLQAWLGIPTSIAGAIMPAVVLAVGISDAVHVLTLVYQRLVQGDPRQDALAFALGHCGLAILMTSVTTAGGLLSFAFSDLGEIRNLGLAAPTAIMLTFVFSVVLLPALVAVLPLSAGARRRSDDPPMALQRWVVHMGLTATRFPGRVLLATGLIVAVALFGASRLRFSDDVLAWFPSDDSVKLSTEMIDRELGGSETLELLIDTGIENGLHEPDVLNRIERAADFAQRFTNGPIEVGAVTSLIDIVKETHRALNEGDEVFYAIPQDRRLVAQELLLFENSGSDDLGEIVDTTFRQARLSIRVPFVDGMYYLRFIEEITEALREILGPDLQLQVTGGSALGARIYTLLTVNMARSYTIALLLIAPLMVMFIGRLKLGLLAMVPNLIPVVLALGLMGWAGSALDSSNLLAGCIILGLAVDDTIHFMDKFRRYFEESGDLHGAVRKTLETTGSALLVTTLVLAGGFMAIGLASMRNLTEIGLITAFAAGVAFLADVLVAPALLALLLRRRAAPAARI